MQPFVPESSDAIKVSALVVAGVYVAPIIVPAVDDVDKAVLAVAVIALPQQPDASAAALGFLPAIIKPEKGALGESNLPLSFDAKLGETEEKITFEPIRLASIDVPAVSTERKIKV